METLITLTCRECGHREQTQADRALMARVRMYNHLNRAHAEHLEPFKTAVRESQRPAREARR